MITAPGSTLEHAGDLAGKPVAVNFHTGSHYGAVQMLGGVLSRDEMRLVHYGGPMPRWEALLRGEIAATCMMEPWISFAEQKGCRVLAEARYRGAEVVSWDTPPETVRAFVRGLNRAVDLFNADPAAYVPLILADLPPALGRVDPASFKLSRLAYVPVRPYPREEFDRAYRWMLHWGLVEEGIAYEDVVDPECLGDGSDDQKRILA